MSLFTVNCFAFTVPDKPPNNTYVLDQANKLTSNQIDDLNSKIEHLNQNTKNEYGILIIQSLDGATIEDAAQDTFRAWGIGKKELNNGILVMVSVNDRKMRIQTGKNVEGDLPDLLAHDILANTLKPKLRKGKFYQGLSDTIDAISSHIESRNKPQTTPSVSHSKPLVISSNNDSTKPIFVNYVVIFILLIMILCLFICIYFYNKACSKSYKTSSYDDLYDLNKRISRVPTPIHQESISLPINSHSYNKQKTYSSNKKHSKSKIYKSPTIVEPNLFDVFEISSTNNSTDSKKHKSLKKSDSFTSSNSFGDSDDFSGFGGGDSGGGGSSDSW